MQGDVDDVVSADVEAAGRIVEGKRKIDEWPARDRRLAVRKQDSARARQVTDLFVLNNRRLVVDDEGGSKAVRVNQHNGESDDRRSPADAARAASFVARRTFRALLALSHRGFLYRARTTVAGVGVVMISTDANPASFNHER